MGAVPGRSTQSLAIMESIATPRPPSDSSTSLALAIAVVVHAAAVTVLWWFMIYADQDLVPVRVWVLLALSWLAWPLAVAVRRSRLSKLVVGATIAGTAVYAPVASTLYSFAAWSIGGFAP
jgi:hypothetical protein